MKKFDLTKLLTYIVTAELVGAFSALVAGGNFKEFYQKLVMPPIAPPSWVFPVAWAILYAIMGTAAFIVSEQNHENTKKAMYIYTAQLFINFLWSPVFFGLGSLTGGVIVAAILVGAVVLNIIFFAKISDTAALMLIPYLIWSAYALYLSIGFRVLN